MRRLKILSIVGARPQFVKLAPVARAVINLGHSHLTVHTGQHYDRSMSAIFFEQLGIPNPDINLCVGSASHAQQTSAILGLIEPALLESNPDVVVVFGDTNSTLAGALAASKLRIPLAHVEAGLRSFNRTMPEEINRILTDHCSDLLLCPSRNSCDQLEREGITNGVHFVGDVMLDVLLDSRPASRKIEAELLARLDVKPGQYLLATMHRPYTVDDPSVLLPLLQTLLQEGRDVVLPIHPRTRSRLEAGGFALPRAANLRLIEPVGFLEMLALEANSHLIVTDSGGVQKEAFFLRVPCLTVRSETEWTETVDCGWNSVVGHKPAQLRQALKMAKRPDAPPPPCYGDGTAAKRIAELLEQV